ncbi:MAG TPA: PASTA domain-containing protein [Solirubrobacterales bacterium]
MTARSRDLAVALFAAALLTIAMAFALTAERASALLQQPPSDVTILHVEWDRAETSPGVISEGVKSVFPQSAFTEVSGKTSDFFKQASYGVFTGWTTNFGGTLKIAAPRLPSGQGGRSQPCDTRFFEDIVSRADAAAQAKGVSLGSATVYYFDEKLCAQMPDAGAEAAFMTTGKKAVMQITRTIGPTRHELVHAVGHFMKLPHADSLNCTASGARVPFSDQCTVEAAGDPYDSMGEGTGTFSAGAIKALGWLKDEQHKEDVAPVNDVRQTYALGTITDGGSITPLPTRAIRFTDGGTNFWVEFRGRTGLDATEPPFPAQGSTGVLIHKEIKAPFGREPIFQLIDLSPSTPRSDAGLKLPTQSWTNPLGRAKINFVNFTTGGAFVSIGPKPEVPPPPAEPTQTNLVVQVGWQGQSGGTKAPDAFAPQARLTEASGLASKWIGEVSSGREGWRTTYGGEITIPAPRTQFVGAGLANRCDAQTFTDINSAAEAALKAKGVDPSIFDNVVYVYNGTVCEQMPDARGTALPVAKRVVVQATGANFGAAQSGSRTLIEAVGNQRGLNHSPALVCIADADSRIPVPFSRTCITESDPYGVMGGGTGSFSAPEQDQLGWMKRPNRFDEVIRENLPGYVIAPLETVQGPTSFKRRAVFLPEGHGGFWVEYRRPIGVDAPSVSGSPENVLGLLIHREEQRQTPDGIVRSFHLIDATPGTPRSDAALPIGRRVRVGKRLFKLERADENEAEFSAVDTEGEAVNFPDPLPHPVPPSNPDPEHSLLVLNVGWESADPDASSLLEEELLDKTSYMVNGPVNQWFREVAPAGLFEDWQAYSGGNFMIASPVLPGTEGAEIECDPDAIWARAERAAEGAGLQPGRFGHVMVSLSSNPCGFAGLSHIRGRQSIVTGYAKKIIVHELGHTLGLLHAQSVRCYEGAGEARRAVTLSPVCDVTEYGDLNDVMGLGSGPFNPAFANQLGWLRNQFISLNAGNYERTFNLLPYAGQEPPIEGQMRAIRLIDGPTTLWMEWREPVGPDSGVRSGLYIRRERMAGTNLFSQLLDMTPATDGTFDAALPVGQTWVNPLGTMEITLNEGGPSGATVTIKGHSTPVGTPDVTMPDLTGDNMAEIGAELGPLGLSLNSVSALVDDCLGTSIDRVIDQNVAPGTRVFPSTKITVRMGQKPRNMSTCQ